MITYDDFKKVEMKAGTIVSAEIVEGADKLYKFMVDFGLKPSQGDGSPKGDSALDKPDQPEAGLGEEKDVRQILSAIREYFPDPEFFPGKQFMFVTNLEPRTIRGLESNGMILAVDGEDGNPVFVTPKEAVPNGSAMR